MYIEYTGSGILRCKLETLTVDLKKNVVTKLPAKLVSEVEALADSRTDVKMYFEAPATYEAPAVTELTTTPAGTIALEEDETFIIEVHPEGNGIFELEVDHSLSAILPEFSLYADPVNPYGGADSKKQFIDAGVIVTYARGKWTIDFGKQLTELFKTLPNVTFYFVAQDIDGKDVWGSMSPTTPENTRKFTVTNA